MLQELSQPTASPERDCIDVHTPEMWRKTAHSTGDSESASRDAAALWVGTHTLQTWATAAGMKGVGKEAKKPSRVAATSCGVALSGICMVHNTPQEPSRMAAAVCCGTSQESARMLYEYFWFLG